MDARERRRRETAFPADGVAAFNPPGLWG